MNMVATRRVVFCLKGFETLGTQGTETATACNGGAISQLNGNRKGSRCLEPQGWTQSHK